MDTCITLFDAFVMVMFAVTDVIRRLQWLNLYSVHDRTKPVAIMSAAKRAKGKTTKKRPQRATSNVFAMFDQSQIQEFKEAFNMIDQNRDGFIDKEDLHDMLASLGNDIIFWHTTLNVWSGPKKWIKFVPRPETRGYPSCFGWPFQSASNVDIQVIRNN